MGARLFALAGELSTLVFILGGCMRLAARLDLAHRLVLLLDRALLDSAALRCEFNRPAVTSGVPGRTIQQRC